MLKKNKLLLFLLYTNNYDANHIKNISKYILMASSTCLLFVIGYNIYSKDSNRNNENKDDNNINPIKVLKKNILNKTKEIEKFEDNTPKKSKLEPEVVAVPKNLNRDLEKLNLKKQKNQLIIHQKKSH